MSTYPHPQQSSNLSSWPCGVGPELDKQHHLASCCLLIGYGQREALGLPGRVVESLSQWLPPCLSGIGCNSYLLIVLSIQQCCPCSILIIVPFPWHFGHKLGHKLGVLFPEVLCHPFDFLKSSSNIHSLCWTQQFLRWTSYLFPGRAVEAENINMTRNILVLERVPTAWFKKSKCGLNWFVVAVQSQSNANRISW